MARGKRISDPQALQHITDKLQRGEPLAQEDRASLHLIARPDLISLVEAHHGPLRASVKNSVHAIVAHLLGPEPAPAGLPPGGGDDAAGARPSKRRRVELRMVADPDNPGVMRLAPADVAPSMGVASAGALPAATVPREGVVLTRSQQRMLSGRQQQEQEHAPAQDPGQLRVLALQQHAQGQGGSPPSYEQPERMRAFALAAQEAGAPPLQPPLARTQSGVPAASVPAHTLPLPGASLPDPLHLTSSAGGPGGSSFAPGVPPALWSCAASGQPSSALLAQAQRGAQLTEKLLDELMLQPPLAAHAPRGVAAGPAAVPPPTGLGAVPPPIERPSNVPPESTGTAAAAATRGSDGGVPWGTARARRASDPDDSDDCSAPSLAALLAAASPDPQGVAQTHPPPFEAEGGQGTGQGDSAVPRRPSAQ